MPGYIEKSLLKFQHTKNTTVVNTPYKHTPIIYGTKQQYATIDTSPKLNAKEITRIQNIVGTLLYYARAVNSKLAAALITISSQQANGTEATTKNVPSTP